MAAAAALRLLPGLLLACAAPGVGRAALGEEAAAPVRAMVAPKSAPAGPSKESFGGSEAPAAAGAPSKEGFEGSEAPAGRAGGGGHGRAEEEAAAAASEGPRCQMTSYPLRYGQRAGVFGLPGEALEGQEAAHPCAALRGGGGGALPFGELVFACRRGRWSYAKDTCAACRAASMRLNDSSVAGVFDLPRTLSEGSRKYFPCSELNQTSYRHGSVAFVCQSGAWHFEGQTCNACPRSTFTLEYGGLLGDFDMPEASADGQQVEHACEFSGERFAHGYVRFACQAGEWGYLLDTCAACEATAYAASHELLRGTFALPRGGSRGLRLREPCEFNGAFYREGWVEFECLAGGWSLVNDTCGACPQEDSFVVAYGSDVGSFELPRASDGELLDRPCVFGKKSYGAGRVEFACEAGFWQLKTVTCVTPTARSFLRGHEA